MLSVDLLVAGDAADGPVEEIVPIRDLEHARRLFGGYAYERVTLTSSSTGHTLTTTPWAHTVQPLRDDSDGVLIPVELFEFAVNGTALTWNKHGLWYHTGATPLDVTFRVLPRPGATSLLRGIQAALAQGVNVHAVRLGSAVYASVAAGNFTFRALHPGSRYNGTQIVVASGQVTITPSSATGRKKIYTVTSDQNFADQLRDDLLRDRQRLTLSGPNSTTALTIPTGTYVLAGGVDGTFSASSLATFLDEYELLGVDVLYPTGLTLPNLVTAGIPTRLADAPYPTLVVAPGGATATVTLSGTPNTSRYVGSVAFDATYDRGTPFERIETSAPMVAALLARERFGGTLGALPHFPLSPTYDSIGIHTLTEVGRHLVGYQSISKGPALWQAVTGDPLWSVSAFRAYQEIVRAIYLVLEPFLGGTVTRLETLRTQVDQALAEVLASQVLEWDLERRDDTLFAEVTFRPHGEIRSVTAQVALGTPLPTA